MNKNLKFIENIKTPDTEFGSGVIFVRFIMTKPPAMLVVGIKSFSFKQ